MGQVSSYRKTLESLIGLEVSVEWI